MILLFRAGLERLIQIAVLRIFDKQRARRNSRLVSQRTGELTRGQIVIKRVRNADRSCAFELVYNAWIDLIQIVSVGEVMAEVRKICTFDDNTAGQLS